MGRWANASRSGGGITSPNAIINAFLPGGVEVRLEYSANVDATQLNFSAFQSLPSSLTALSVTQLSPRLISLEFDDSVEGDTTIAYTGDTPGILTPQTVPYT